MPLDATIAPASRKRRADADPVSKAVTGALLYLGDKVLQIDLMRPANRKPLELSP